MRSVLNLSAGDDFNPRFPRGKRHCSTNSNLDNIKISIHASRGGSDLTVMFLAAWAPKFQSTLPAGEATFCLCFIGKALKISIHASRGGSDLYAGTAPGGAHISIHASRGGSDFRGLVNSFRKKVISIHASRGGSDADDVRDWNAGKIISIHASRGGSDLSAFR